MRKKGARALSVALMSAMVLSCANPGVSVQASEIGQEVAVSVEENQQSVTNQETDESVDTEEVASTEEKELSNVQEDTEDTSVQNEETKAEEKAMDSSETSTEVENSEAPELSGSEETDEEGVDEKEAAEKEEELDVKLANSGDLVKDLIPDANLRQAVRDAYNTKMDTSYTDSTFTYGQLSSFDGALNLAGYSAASSVKSLEGLGYAKKAASIDISTFTGVTEIKPSEFAGCEFTEIKLPTSITTIGSNTFSKCKKLQTITLPDGLKTLGSKAFESCEGLEYINTTSKKNTLPAGLTSVGDMVFVYNTSLQEITIPDLGSVIENSVSLFYGCKKLSSITIGKGLKTIPGSCFTGAGSELESGLELKFETGSKLDKILGSAFADVKLQNDTVDLSACTELTTISTSAFDGAKNLHKVILPEKAANTIKIGEYAFSNTELNTLYETGDEKEAGTIYLPNSISSIGQGVFCNYKIKKENGKEVQEVASQIKKVSLSPYLTDVPDYAFDGCTSLAEVEQRTNNGNCNVKAIGDCAFRDTAIASAEFMANMNQLEVIGYQHLSEYGVGESGSDLEKIKSLARGGKDENLQISNPSAADKNQKKSKDGRTVYGSEVFTGCKNLTKVIIPASVKSIGSRAFYFKRIETTNATTVELLKTNSKIASIEWQSGVQADRVIYSEAFHGNTSLKKLTLPETTGDTLDIRPYAFYANTALSEVRAGSGTENTLPIGLTNLGEGAFFWCASLENFSVRQCNSLEKKAFEKCIGLNTISIPNNITEIPDRLCYDTQISKMTISPQVKKIGAGAFFGCRFMTLDLSGYENLEEIGPVAFAYVDTILETKNGKGTICYNYYENRDAINGVITAAMQKVILPDELHNANNNYLFLNSGVFCGQCKLNTLRTESRGIDGEMYIPKYIPNDPDTEGRKMVGYGVFADTGVTRMVWENPTSWTEIPELTFNACGNIEKAEDVLPLTNGGNNTLKAIGKAAFLYSRIRSVDLTGCTAITEIGSKKSNGNISSSEPGAFQGCYFLETVKMPKSNYTLGERSFYMGYSESSTQPPNDVPPLTMLTNVELGGVTEIQKEAFAFAFKKSSYNSTLVDIILPDTLTKVGEGVFKDGEIKDGEDGQDRLKSVTLPASLKDISSKMFYYQTALETVNLDSIEKIGSQAFEGTVGLGAVTFGEKLTMIDTNAFKSSGLPSLNFEKANNLEKISNGAFSKAKNLTEFKMTGTKVTEIDTILQECEKLQKAQFGSEVQYIKENALAGCPKLDKLKVASTTTVDPKIFYQKMSTGLTSSANGDKIVVEVDTPEEPIVIPTGRKVRFPYYMNMQGQSYYTYVLIAQDNTSLRDHAETYFKLRADLSDGYYKFHNSDLEAGCKIAVGDYYEKVPQSELTTTVASSKKVVDTLEVEGLKATTEPITFSIANRINFPRSEGGAVEAAEFVANYKVAVQEVETSVKLFTDRDRKEEFVPAQTNPIQVTSNSRYVSYYYDIVDSVKTYSDLESYDLVIKTDNPNVLVPANSTTANVNSYNAESGLVVAATTKNSSTGIVTKNDSNAKFNLVATGVGTANITVYPKEYPQYTKTYQYVVNADVSSISLKVPTEYNSKGLEPGTTFSVFSEYKNVLNQSVKAGDVAGYNAYTNNVITYTSDAPDIASVDNMGNVTITGSVTKDTRITITAQAQTSVENKSVKTSTSFTLKSLASNLKADQTVADAQSGATLTITRASADASRPGEVKYMKPDANATAVTVPDTVELYGVPYKVTAVEANAFKGNKKVQSVVISASVKSIDKDMFNGCTALKKVKLPATITLIGDNAFKNCKSLTEIAIPDAVTKIGKSAFYGCKSLKKVSINSKKSKLTDIGNSAFEKCGKLTSITLPSKLATLGSKVFYDCKKLKTITIKSTSVRTVGKNAFKNIYKKATIKVPKSKLSDYKKLLKGKGQKSTVKIKK